MNLTVLLVAPPVLHARGWWGNRTANKPHFASLAGAIADIADVRHLELDRDADETMEAALLQLDDALERERPRLVGVSCWSSMHYLGSVAVIRRIREVAPDAAVVVGGHHASAVPSDFEGLADWVVIGDGEQALRQLCEQRPTRPASTVMLRPAPMRVMDPDAIDWRNYGSHGRAEKGGAVWLVTSRGCAFKCRYCMEPLRGTMRSTYSVDATLRIIDGLMRTHEPTAFAFADPLFGANRTWTAKLLAGLAARAYPVTYWAQTRADLMTAELIAGFAKANFKLDFGLDTGSLQMATLMQKSPTPQRYLDRSAEILRVASDVGLHHGIYLLFNYPGETPDTAAATRRYIERLGDIRGPMSGWLSAQTFFILPGTESFAQLEANRERFGTEVVHPDWWRLAGDHYALATRVLPSRAYRGREHELGAFAGWAQQVNAGWSERYVDEVRAFCRWFYRGQARSES